MAATKTCPRTCRFVGGKPPCPRGKPSVTLKMDQAALHRGSHKRKACPITTTLTGFDIRSQFRLGLVATQPPRLSAGETTNATPRIWDLRGIPVRRSTTSSALELQVPPIKPENSPTDAASPRGSSVTSPTLSSRRQLRAIGSSPRCRSNNAAGGSRPREGPWQQ